MRASEMKDLTVEELRQKEQDFKKELFNLRFQTVTGEIQNPKRIKAVRKDIARILTVITEKTKEQKNKE
jgi:large subunit ribosomal protein L29